MSPKNLKINFHLKKEFNGFNNLNKNIQFYLPNLKGGNLSPSFIHGFKLKDKFNLDNLNNQLKLKLNKHKQQNIGINYKKLINNKGPLSLKRNSSTSMFNQFINNNINRGLSSKTKRNNENNNLGLTGTQFYSYRQSKKKYHNSSDIMG